MTVPRISDEQRRRRLAVRHLLAPGSRLDGLSSVVDAMVALHSSDPVSVYLAAAARMARPSIATIEDSLYRTREVFRHHAMRRTLWVMGPDTVGPAHASCTTKIAHAEERRFLGWLEATPGISEPGPWMKSATNRIIEFLGDNGAATTREIGNAMPDLAVPVTVRQGQQQTTMSAHSRILLIAGFNGQVVRSSPQGSWIASNYLWDTAERWGLPDLTEDDSRTGAAKLLIRVLDRFGPCSTEDLRWWTGWTVTMLKRALDDIAAVKVEIDPNGTAWVNAGDLDEVGEPGPWVALLPGLDPTTMGWKLRDWYLGTDIAERVFDRNGNAGPTIWVDGRVVGGWAQRPDGEIVYDLHQKLDREHLTLLEEATSRLVTFIGSSRFRIRFPPPNQKELLA